MIDIKKSDIGGEIISILTKGMYADPRDALREYVQNGVDAGAKNIYVKIRKNNIIIEDDGSGMTKEIMRRAVRLGVSDKNPKKHVGFMGIGIYSAFHLCDKLTIYSKVQDQRPNYLTFGFKDMRDILEQQRDARFNNAVNDNELIALQELLEQHIELNTIDESDYPKNGTRVELIGLEPDFFKTLSKFEEVSTYLEQTIPLHFDPKFRWGQLIEEKINESCKGHNASFELINLTLQINEDSKLLYRPYKDDYFDYEPLQPYFYEIKEGDDFFGVAWGCLNSARSAIKNKHLRGFLIKKQGFSIGSRDSLIKYFGRTALFNRYIGEIIVVHPQLLPNAPRNDFEFSPLRISFYNCVGNLASWFNEKANQYQEYSIAEEELNETILFIKEIRAQLNYFIDNGDKLLDFLFDLKEKSTSLQGRFNRGWIPSEKKEVYEQVVNQIEVLNKEIKDLIEAKKKKAKTVPKLEKKIIEELKQIPDESDVPAEVEYNSLIDVIDSVGIDLTKDMKKLLNLIDEYFIQVSVKDKKDYSIKLKTIKQKFEELMAD
jgi:hypothetical protein